jgi:hypothetical protein
MGAMVQLDISASRKRDFYFDHAFGPSSTQDHVYNTIARPVVDGVLNGFNGTVFAYGQTGTGKTYTMGILNQLRGQSTAGIVPRAVEHIFESEQMLPTGNVTVSMSFLQIYNNSIQDLISDSAQMESNLPLREDPRKGFYVEGLSNFAVASYEEAQELVNFGLENRAIAPTLMNTTSSRSHTVLTVHVEKREAADAASEDVSRTLRGKLLLVDLAGSERVRRTTSKGARLSEAKAINTSLSVLGNVIAALAEPGTTHIPFRDSKLTRLLQDSLGGTASTVCDELLPRTLSLPTPQAPPPPTRPPVHPSTRVRPSASPRLRIIDGRHLSRRLGQLQSTARSLCRRCFSHLAACTLSRIRSSTKRLTSPSCAPECKRKWLKWRNHFTTVKWNSRNGMKLSSRSLYHR